MSSSQAVPGFTLVVMMLIDGQGSHVEQHIIYTDGVEREVFYEPHQIWDWTEYHYSLKDGRWVED